MQGDKFRSILNKARRQQGKTLRQVQDELGYSHGTIDGWESGYRTPDINRFIEWANYLGYDVILARRRDNGE